MRYAQIVAVYERLEATPKKLEKRDILADFYRDAPDVDRVVLLSMGLVSTTEELGLARGLVTRVIMKAYGVDTAALTKAFKETGDLGDTAAYFAGRSRQRTLGRRELTVGKVFDNLRQLPAVTGTGSQERKQQLVIELLTSAEPAEARYIIRTILGDMRIGVAWGIVRDAIAQAFGKEPAEIERIFDVVGDFGRVALMAKEGKMVAEIQVGRPIRVMLADRAKDLEDGLKQWGAETAIQYKFDGFRVQCHKKENLVKIFSRRLEDVTPQFPDIVSMVKSHINAKECIVEGEAVAIKDNRPQPFQMLSRRIRRKFGIEKMVKEIPVQVNLFDLLFLNGESYMDKPFRERWGKLKEIVDKKENSFQLAKHIEYGNIVQAERFNQQAREFYQNALADGQEGVIVKNLTAPYKPGKRVGFWLKVKDILEPLDLVVTGAEWGEGKRSRWLGSLILSARDGKGFVETGRMASGLTEEQMESLTKILKKLIVKEEGRIVTVRPDVVVEIGYEEIQQSPKYPSGYALRFPRLLRIRDDKGPKDANTLRDVERLFKLQK